MIHHRQVLSTPLVGGGVGDTERGILFGIVGVTVRPDQDGVAVPAGREVPRTIDIESLLLVSVDRIGRVARQGPHHLVGRNLERARGLRVGRGPCLPAHATTHHSATVDRRHWRRPDRLRPTFPRPRRPCPRRPPSRRPSSRPGRRPRRRRAAGSRAAHAAARSAACRSSRRVGLPVVPPVGLPAVPPVGLPLAPPCGLPDVPPVGLPVVPPVGLPLAPPCGLPDVPPVGLPVVPPSLPLPPAPEEPLPPEPHAAIKKARQIPAIDRRVCLMHIIMLCIPRT